MSSFLTISLLEESIYGFFLTISSRYAGRLQALLAAEAAARSTTGETFTGIYRSSPTYSMLCTHLYGRCNCLLFRVPERGGRLLVLFATETAARSTTGETFTGEERCLPFLQFHY